MDRDRFRFTDAQLVRIIDLFKPADDQWETVKSLVSGGRKDKSGPCSDGCRFFHVLLWMARSGGRWRDLSEDWFGRYQTATTA